MNTDILKGRWMQLKGQIKDQWAELTDDDLDRIEGQYDQLVGRIQEAYGLSREEAEDEVDEFLREYA